MRIIIVFCSLLFSVQLLAQGPYAPAVGSPSTTAMYKDSVVFVDWATAITIERGWQDITDTALGKATVGDDLSAIGKPDNIIVSLGDSGIVIATFDAPIYDRVGVDFAVFENSFSDDFLELAFVEVSSDGIHYVRFPAHSLTQDTLQTAPFGTSEATNLYNLAGKYRGGYGTPFDLAELKDSANLDINNINYIKIVDVVGCINCVSSTKDTAGNFINDPFPTQIASSGFDLDAIGVVGEPISNSIVSFADKEVQIFPTLFSDVLKMRGAKQIKKYSVSNLQGIQVLSGNPNTTSVNLDASVLKSGVYFIRVETEDGFLKQVKVIKL